MMTGTNSPQKSWKDPTAYKTENPEAKRPEDIIDHRSNRLGGPLLSYVWCKDSLQGQELYLGAEVGSDGKIYCIPGHAQRVMQVDPSDNDRAILVGPIIPGKYKWLRGVKYGTAIYGIPCHAETVLKIQVEKSGDVSVTELPIDYESSLRNPEESDEHRRQCWKYHGGSVCPVDGCIYCIPQSAAFVLKIDPITDTCTVFGVELPGRYKWYGGVVGKLDGAIYGIPHNSPSVLRIHPVDGVTLHGSFDGLHKWHGASASPDGIIVCIPANADSVLCISPAVPEPELFQLGELTLRQGSVGRHRSDRKYKYLGGSEGPDGRVYCFPCASERVLAVDTVHRRVEEVGPNIYDQNLERICQNKWQNGVYDPSNRVIWGIPLAAESILKIDFPVDRPEPLVTTWSIPSPHRGLSKWEGGILAPNGVVYTVPNNHKAMLRVEIGTSRDVPNLMYRSGIPTLRASAHRVKFSKKNRAHNPRPLDANGAETNTFWLPASVREKDLLPYDLAVYNFQSAVTALLRRCDPEVVGSFTGSSEALENFRIPTSSTWRKVNGGHCEESQRYLSEQVQLDVQFVEIFDQLVHEVIGPYLGARLRGSGFPEGSVTLYYQRPPTLRLQPGPAWSQVSVHNDAEYGHQFGELNFWVPLTDRNLTRVDLWCESEFNEEDYRPVKASVGEIAVFHGSSCRHYVNSNPTPNTRVSFDFRVGVQGFFDPNWEMQGTNDDHTRQSFTIVI